MGDEKLKTIELVWKGPFKLNDLENKYPEADKAGVYILARGGPKSYQVHYIGQAINLRKRLREHLMCYLGGGYCLYNLDELKDEKPSDSDLGKEYTPDIEETVFFKEFIVNLEKNQKLARNNLEAFTYFWAPIEKNERDDKEYKIARETVESGLITAAGKDNIENSRVSRSKLNAPRIYITSKFGENSEYKINDITDPFEYGNLEYTSK